MALWSEDDDDDQAKAAAPAAAAKQIKSSHGSKTRFLSKVKHWETGIYKNKTWSMVRLYVRASAVKRAGRFLDASYMKLTSVDSFKLIGRKTNIS